MGWPQWVIALWFVVSTILSFADEAKDLKRSSVWLTGYLFTVIGFFVLIGLVLHCGGFW